MYTQIAIFCAALVASANFAQAGKCSDHLLSLKADSWNDEASSQYGIY